MSWLPIGLVACSRDDAGREQARSATSVPAAPTTTWVTPVPGTVTSVARPLPTAAAPSAAWTELLTIPYGDGELEVGRGATAAVPVGRGAWVVLDHANEDVRTLTFDAAVGEWTMSAAALPPGVAGAGAGAVPLVAGGYVLPVASGGLLIEDQLGDPEVVDAGVAEATWVYSDGLSLFSTDGRALDRAWNNETSVRRVDAFRTPSDDRFRVDVDDSSVVVDLFDIDQRLRVDVGAPPEVELDADLGGTVHVLVHAGARAGYLSISHDGTVSEIEPVPAAARLRVIPDTTTVALSAAMADGLHVWTRVASDPFGIVSADLPEETCQWVRDYTERREGTPAPTMQLAQGSVPGFPPDIRGAWLSSADGVFRADLDGDGATDAAFVVWCSVGVSGHNAEIHAVDAGGRSIGRIEVGEDDRERGLWSFDVDGADLVVEYPSWEPDETGCCGTLRVTDRYRWSDGGFQRVDRRTWSAADGSTEILAAFNRASDDAVQRADPDAFVALRQLRDEHGALEGCTTTENAPGDAPERTCVITATDEPDVAYRLTLTWIDVDEWRATALEPIAG